MALKMISNNPSQVRFSRIAAAVVFHCLLIANLTAQAELPSMDSTAAERIQQAARHASRPGPVGPLLGDVPPLTILPRPDDEMIKRMRLRFGRSWIGPLRLLPAEANAAIGSDAATIRPGRWGLTDQGLAVWRTTIRSTGASAMRVHFESFDVEGRVYAYPHGADASTPVAGPYGGLGPQGDGDFWSEVIFSDSVTIEYVPRRDTKPPSEPPFRIIEITHILPGIFRAPGKPTNWSPFGPPSGQPRAIVGCHLDGSCYPEWQDADYRSDALLVITKAGGSWSCSGTLINTQYETKTTLFMLTAAHCIGDNEAAQNTEFYWNYESDQCYGQPDTRNLVSTEGATLVVARGPDRYDDFSLLKLDKQDVLSVTGIRMRGWTPSQIPLGTDVVKVSHPDGDFKRIAFGETVAENWRNLSSAGFDSIRWRRGTTEAGSSGSAVLRESDGRLIGVYAGSNSEDPCDSEYRGYFNRFDRIYDEIEPYLESESSLRNISSIEITVPLGSSGDALVLVRAPSGKYTLDGSPFESGRIVSAKNGNKYRLTRGNDGTWTAVFLAEAIEVTLSSGADVVTLLRSEDRQYSLDDQVVRSGSTIAHRDRGTYKLSLGPGRTWLAEPILAPAQRAGQGFAIQTVAGSGSYGFSGDKGQASAARLANPSGIAVSDTGEIFIADTENHRIRRVSPSGVIETVAGTGRPGFSGDRRAATRASLSSPRGLALDGTGRLYIADSGNHRIRAVDTDGIISTIAGTRRPGFFGDDGPATASRLTRPHAVAVDALGDVYIADTGNHRIRRVSNKIITTVAGSSRIGFAGDDGPANLAALNTPEGIAVDMFGVVHIADTRNHRVRRVDLDGSITTIMGTGRDSYGGDGGPATSASLRLPKGVAVDWRGGVYVADTGNHALRRINSSGLAETVAGSGRAGSVGDGEPSNRALLSSPAGLWVDLRSEVYIADVENRKIRQLRASWKVIPDHLAPVSVTVPLGDSGLVARLWKSGTQYTYSGSSFEPGDFVWGPDGLRYQLNNSPTGGLQATLAPPNYSELLDSIRPAAQNGDADAQAGLGALYYFGDGVTQDYEEALRWFRLAGAQGDEYAHLFLGYIHEWGLAVDVDLPQAAEWYRRAAARGRSAAHYRLARLLQRGDGVASNLASARRLFLLAASKDNSRAQVSLGYMYEDAIGVPEDFPEAAKWFRLAAEQGNPRGQVDLGRLYYSGRGVLRNPVVSELWFRRAASQGFASGQLWLGWLYERGEGVTKNLAESARWYRLAAEQGNTFSQWQLGQAYASGSGVARNAITAYVWLSLAVENGRDDARRELSALRQTMTESEIQDANAIKARCSESGYEACP